MEKKEKHLFRYEGSVRLYSDTVASKWRGETMAVSAKKATANLVHRFKKEHGFVPSTAIKLGAEPIQIY